MNILCAIFGMWCAVSDPPFNPDWQAKVISGETIPDVIVQVPPCVDGPGNAEMISASIAHFQEIQQNVSPSSDAAAHDHYGAVVVTQLPAGLCVLVSAIKIEGGWPFYIRGSMMSMSANSDEPVFSVTQRR